MTNHYLPSHAASPPTPSIPPPEPPQDATANNPAKSGDNFAPTKTKGSHLAGDGWQQAISRYHAPPIRTQVGGGYWRDGGGGGDGG